MKLIHTPDGSAFRADAVAAILCKQMENYTTHQMFWAVVIKYGNPGSALKEHWIQCQDEDDAHRVADNLIEDWEGE